MNKPKMILFDYGNTLLYEPEFDFLRGEEALFPYITRNENGLTPKQVDDFSQELFERISAVRGIGFELHERQFQQYVYEYLGIEFSIPLPEVERILWENASPGAPMPNVETMLDYIHANKIRSGVISNIGWSGTALTERIRRLLPRSKFEFVMASSEYLFRKPSPFLFELALKKARLNAEDVWFCGDNIRADVEGSAAVGIFPVWYEDLKTENPWREQNEREVPSCAHCHIADWLDLIDVLRDC